MPGPVPLPALPTLVRTPLTTLTTLARGAGSRVHTTVCTTVRGGLGVVSAVAAVPRLAAALTGLHEAAVHLEQLATFAAGELPEAVYQLETIREQLDALRRQLTAIELQLAALRPVTSAPEQ